MLHFYSGKLLQIHSGVDNWDDAAFIDEAEYQRYPDYQLKDGDVLISLDRPIIRVRTH